MEEARGLMVVGGAAQLIPSWAFYAIPWTLALWLAIWSVPRRGIIRGLGLGLMTVPLWDTLLGIIDSFGPLLQGGVTLLPFSTYQLSGLYSYKLLGDLGYLAVGFLLFAGGRRFWDETPQSLAQKLAALGVPLGRGEGRSAFVGVLAFPVLLTGTFLVGRLTAGAQSLRQSDENLVWANMTPYHAVLISAAAAFSEELLFRGLVQTALVHAGNMLERRGVLRPVSAIIWSAGPLAFAVGLVWIAAFAPVALLIALVVLAIVAAGIVATWRWGPVVLAITLQALLFGFAHAGYATWIHVLLPTLFGLVAGIAAWRFGLWAGIVLHFVVDFFAFLSETGDQQPWALPLLNVLFYANLALTVGWAIAWLVRWVNKQDQHDMAS